MLSSLKAAAPWWTKIVAKLALSRVPMGYRQWQRIGLFRHGRMDTTDYALGVFEAHISSAEMVGKLKGKTILELGPGDSIATAVIAHAFGARAILVDSGAYAIDDVRPYRVLVDALASRGLAAPDISKARTIQDILEAADGRYLTSGLDAWAKIPNESVDLVFSQAVLEHIRKHEFLETMINCRSVMKKGAVGSHRIDLRDHLSGALNNLRFSERVWESEFFARSGFYTNRIRFSEMLDLFERAGFEVQLGEVRRWEGLPTPRAKLSAEFSHLSEPELNVSGFGVLLRTSRGPHGPLIAGAD